MKVVYNTNEIPFKWETVAIAHWLKYPHDANPTIKTVDVIDRRTENSDPNILKSTRLIALDGVPDFVARALGSKPTMFNCEQSFVDRCNKTLTLQTFNISLLNLLSVFEETVYSPHPTKPSHTILKQQYRIDVNIFGRYLIESWASQTVIKNASKGIQILSSLCSELEETFDRVSDEAIDTWRNISTISSSPSRYFSQIDESDLLPSKISPSDDLISTTLI